MKPKTRAPKSQPSLSSPEEVAGQPQHPAPPCRAPQQLDWPSFKCLVGRAMISSEAACLWSRGHKSFPFPGYNFIWSPPKRRRGYSPCSLPRSRRFLRKLATDRFCQREFLETHHGFWNIKLPESKPGISVSLAIYLAFCAEEQSGGC